MRVIAAFGFVDEVGEQSDQSYRIYLLCFALLALIRVENAQIADQVIFQSFSLWR
jgi:hypothetical protein